MESVGDDGGHEDQGEDEDEHSRHDELDVEAGRLPLLLPHLGLISSVSEIAGVLHRSDHYYYLTTILTLHPGSLKVSHGLSGFRCATSDINISTAMIALYQLLQTLQL